ncbi:enterobactin transporter EntS [Streptomyces uncialis]|uniref:enterobactin transporter EntS n=1 Tax=Streptomyces uncialis TaxID=1048205 RepID=UPI00386E4C21|nr:enterobactin transporter EntS [Streptomyces uncialis]
MGRLALDLTPLRGRGFRAVFVGRTVAVFGIGFALVAVPLQVYALTGSTARVATVTVAVGAAAFTGTLLGGVLADRFDRGRVIVVARASVGVVFAVLAVNAAAPEPRLWVIYVCGLAEGIADGVSGTALMAATPSLVPKDRLAAAGALMAVTVDLGSVAAPALGGLLVTATGFWGNYAVCAALAVVTTAALSRLPPLPPPGAVPGETAARAVVAGTRFAVRDRIVGPTLLVGLAAMVLSGWHVLLPEYGSRVLGIGPGALGVLYAAPAAGALLTSLTSGWTGRVRRPGAVAIGALLVSGAGLAVTGLAGGVVLAVAGLALFGAGRVAGDVLRYALVQRHTPDRFRGRVAALWTAQITTGVAVGGAVAGGVALLMSPAGAFLVYGAVGVVCAVALALGAATLRGVGPDA